MYRFSLQGNVYISIFTGISVDLYRAAVRGERDLHFVCLPCTTRIPTLDPEGHGVILSLSLSDTHKVMICRNIGTGSLFSHDFISLNWHEI